MQPPVTTHTISHDNSYNDEHHLHTSTNNICAVWSLECIKLYANWAVGHCMANNAAQSVTKLLVLDAAVLIISGADIPKPGPPSPLSDSVPMPASPARELCHGQDTSKSTSSDSSQAAATAAWCSSPVAIPAARSQNIPTLHASCGPYKCTFGKLKLIRHMAYCHIFNCFSRLHLSECCVHVSFRSTVLNSMSCAAIPFIVTWREYITKHCANTHCWWVQVSLWREPKL